MTDYIKEIEGLSGPYGSGAYDQVPDDAASPSTDQRPADGIRTYKLTKPSDIAGLKQKVSEVLETGASLDVEATELGSDIDSPAERNRTQKFAFHISFAGLAAHDYIVYLQDAEAGDWAMIRANDDDLVLTIEALRQRNSP